MYLFSSLLEDIMEERFIFHGSKALFFAFAHDGGCFVNMVWARCLSQSYAATVFLLLYVFQEYWRVSVSASFWYCAGNPKKELLRGLWVFSSIKARLLRLEPLRLDDLGSAVAEFFPKASLELTFLKRAGQKWFQYLDNTFQGLWVLLIVISELASSGGLTSSMVVCYGILLGKLVYGRLQDPGQPKAFKVLQAVASVGGVMALLYLLVVPENVENTIIHQVGAIAWSMQQPRKETVCPYRLDGQASFWWILAVHSADCGAEMPHLAVIVICWLERLRIAKACTATTGGRARAETQETVDSSVSVESPFSVSSWPKSWFARAVIKVSSVAVDKIRLSPTCLPTYLPTYLPTCLLTCLLPTDHPPTYVPAYLPIHHLLINRPTYLPTYLPAYLPTYSLPTYLVSGSATALGTCVRAQFAKFPLVACNSDENCAKWTDELICIFVLVLAFSAALVPGIDIHSLALLLGTGMNVWIVEVFALFQMLRPSYGYGALIRPGRSKPLKWDKVSKHPRLDRGYWILRLSTALMFAFRIFAASPLIPWPTDQDKQFGKKFAGKRGFQIATDSAPFRFWAILATLRVQREAEVRKLDLVESKEARREERKAKQVEVSLPPVAEEAEVRTEEIDADIPEEHRDFDDVPASTEDCWLLSDLMAEFGHVCAFEIEDLAFKLF
ncbi:hypothetical protein AK812_SmicGene15180 [Symbiodinium microadriaticum]|uniref:Uncharacterized protein n=1 Tax=Symbiodinium microadriaticum TaxID=2951 RepID=A0A1Q9E3N1_SYMMI|nr:hypothetical protein AK812_SmicGene15180 [Symbiodinium microadriaticum]